MNGDNEVPSAIIIKMPNVNKKNTIGISQYFFLTFINSKNSFKNDIFKILKLLFHCTSRFIPVYPVRFFFLQFEWTLVFKNRISFDFFWFWSI